MSDDNNKEGQKADILKKLNIKKRDVNQKPRAPREDTTKETTKVPREKEVAINVNTSSEFEMVATCMQNLEVELETELKDLGAKNIVSGKRAITFTGDLELLYKANIWLRTAIKVLKPIYQYNVRSEDDLYQKALKYPWEKVFGSEKTFSISAAVSSELFTHSQYISLRLKDAIVDRFRAVGLDRPNVERYQPDVRIHLHIRDQHVDISLDSSGDPLFKRGYRREAVEAPINETLAAGLILKSGWKGEEDLLDPMCGSGTIAIEAALIAHNIPPNLNRVNFAFEGWSDYDQTLFAAVLGKSKELYREAKGKIFARDIQSNAIRASRVNINSANLRKYITLEQEDFFKAEPPVETGVIISNPPYGERLEVSGGLPTFYGKIGETLKHSYSGWTAWIISSEGESFKNIGLKAKIKYPMMNGKLPCRFAGYELFEGKRKDKLAEES